MIDERIWWLADERAVLNLINDWPEGSATRISFEYRLRVIRGKLAEIDARSNSQIPSPRNDHGLPV